MLLKRYYFLLLLVFLFAKNFLSAQTSYYVMDKYKQYKIVQMAIAHFDFADQKTYYDKKNFIADTLTHDTLLLQIDHADWCRFEHGFVNARIGDQHALLTLDGKVFVERTTWISFYPGDSLISAIGPGRGLYWGLFDFHGTLLASLENGIQGGYDDYMKPFPNGNIMIATCRYQKSLKYALMNKKGIWLTEPVFDSIGKFVDGKTIAKYEGQKGILTENGVFTYPDSKEKINLRGMEKQFPEMGPPYKYINKKNEIAIGNKTGLAPLNPPIKKTSPITSVSNPQVISPPQIIPAHVDTPIPKLIPAKPVAVQKDTSTIFAFHTLSQKSPCKIIWRYSDMSKDKFYRVGTPPYYKSYKDYFLVDSLSHDTVLLAQRTDYPDVTFYFPFFYFNSSKVFTMTGVPVIPNAGLQFDETDSIIIAYRHLKGCSIYNWQQELLFSDTTLSELSPFGHHLLLERKFIDRSPQLFGIVKSNGQSLTDIVFTHLGGFDSTGTAPAEMCNGMKGRLDTTGMFLPDGQETPIHPTIAYLFTDPEYGKIEIRKGEFRGNEGSYYIKINPYCYDKFVTKVNYVSGKYDRRYEYYYLNGKLIAERDIDYYKRTQKLMCKNGGIKKRVRNRHYGTFVHYD